MSRSFSKPDTNKAFVDSSTEWTTDMEVLYATLPTSKAAEALREHMITYVKERVADGYEFAVMLEATEMEYYELEIEDFIAFRKQSENESLHIMVYWLDEDGDWGVFQQPN